MSVKPRVRYSVRDLEKVHYEAVKNKTGEETKLQKLVRAWKGICELDYKDFNSFFVLGGYHGEPFRGAGWSNAAWWGGYCNHGNILFPTWHRGYMLRLEKALQSIEGCEDVMMAYWDETEELPAQDCIPITFSLRKFPLTDGGFIDPNPLFSYKLPQCILDKVDVDSTGNYTKWSYTKPKGYETVRYPLSGLAMHPDTKAHNEKYTNDEQNWKYLTENVHNWLNSYITVDGKKQDTHTRLRYKRSLEAPNYVVFSNATSAGQWNELIQGPHMAGADPDPPKQTQLEVSLERPHGDIHLAVGGFDVPGSNVSPIPMANGDMGENDTAGLDPIFFFHHCHVDRMFWLWQEIHGQKHELVIPEDLKEFPGTNSVDSQGPTPGIAGGTWLDLDSPLAPFSYDVSKPDGPALTSRDVVDIEKQLGYTYGPGSFDELLPKHALQAPVLHRPFSELHPHAPSTAKFVRVHGLDRSKIRGSFVTSVWTKGDDGVERCIGHQSNFSRWRTDGCANCQTHLKISNWIPLPGYADKDLKVDDLRVRVHTHSDPSGTDHGLPDLVTKLTKVRL